MVICYLDTCVSRLDEMITECWDISDGILNEMVVCTPGYLLSILDETVIEFWDTCHIIAEADFWNMHFMQLTLKTRHVCTCLICVLTSQM